MATHFSTRPWKISWAEEPVSLQPQGRKELDMTERLHFFKALVLPVVMYGCESGL